MKILQIANKMPWPPKDGGSIATFSLSKAFQQLGHEVTILAMNTSKHFFDPEKIPGEVKEKIHFETVFVDTTIRPADLIKNFIFSSFPYNADRFVTETFRNSLSEILRRNTFDVIQLEGLYLAPYVETIRKSSDALVAMRQHNVEYEIWQRTTHQQKGIKKTYLKNLTLRVKRMDEKFLNDYDVIVPITRRDGNRFREMGCKLPIHITPTGIDMEAYGKKDVSLDFPSVFHLGALDWMPNQEGIMWFLGKVWPSLRDKYPNLKFYIAGRNAPQSISGLDEPGVVFIGEVEDAYKFMAEKSIMIVPLLSGSGMRIKIIEGMALGKAIVSTSIGTEGIASESGKNIMIADSADGFVQQISRLVEDKDYCSNIGSNAIDFITENFDNLAIAGSLLKFYEEQLP